MATYRTTKCPHCNYALESFTPNARERVGHPANACPNCRGIFKTGMKYWYEMIFIEKTFYLIMQFIISIWTSLCYSVGVIGILFGLLMLLAKLTDSKVEDVIPLSDEILSGSVVALLTILFIFFFVLCCRATKAHIRKYSDRSLKEKLNISLRNGTPIDLQDTYS
jgi:hypothetical protein